MNNIIFFRNTPIKPICFWTYCADSGTCYSPVAMESCEPVWEWSYKMFIPPHRKVKISFVNFCIADNFFQTLVLKLWHRGKEGRDRVLGFVAIMFPIEQPFDRVWYDVIDLTRASTGQVEVFQFFNLFSSVNRTYFFFFRFLLLMRSTEIAIEKRRSRKCRLHSRKIEMTAKSKKLALILPITRTRKISTLTMNTPTPGSIRRCQTRPPSQTAVEDAVRVHLSP